MLTKGIVKRLELPHEPGEWIDIKPLSIADLVEVKQQARTTGGPEYQLSDEDSGMAIALPSLTRGIVAWSYPEAVSAEAIGSLDTETAVYVLRALVPGQLDEADQKTGLHLRPQPRRRR